VNLGALLLASTVALPGLLTGCAYNYVGADGARHLVGLVHLTLPAEGPHAPAASLRAQALGLSYTRADVGTALSLGYSDTTLAYVRDNTCVRWPLAGSAPSTSRRSP
jgi:hypothetical protein